MAGMKGASYNFNHGRLTIPTAQELVGLPSSVIASEIASLTTIIDARYLPNGTFAEMVDRVTIMGKEEHRVFYVDLIRYRANLYMAQQIQASENGIGILDMVRDEPRGQSGWTGNGG